MKSIQQLIADAEDADMQARNETDEPDVEATEESMIDSPEHESTSQPDPQPELDDVEEESEPTASELPGYPESEAAEFDSEPLTDDDLVAEQQPSISDVPESPRSTSEYDDRPDPEEAASDIPDVDIEYNEADTPELSPQEESDPEPAREVPDVDLPDDQPDPDTNPDSQQTDDKPFSGQHVIQPELDTAVGEKEAEAADRQVESRMEARSSLASDLAEELGPAFDSMREHQTQTTHDYVQEQMLLTTLLQVR